MDFFARGFTKQPRAVLISTQACNSSVFPEEKVESLWHGNSSGKWMKYGCQLAYPAPTNDYTHLAVRRTSKVQPASRAKLDLSKLKLANNVMLVNSFRLDFPLGVFTKHAKSAF